MNNHAEQLERLTKAIEMLTARVDELTAAIKKPRAPYAAQVVMTFRDYGMRSNNAH